MKKTLKCQQQKLLELINRFGKLAEYKINVWKAVMCLNKSTKLPYSQRVQPWGEAMGQQCGHR